VGGGGAGTLQGGLLWARRCWLLVLHWWLICGQGSQGCNHQQLCILASAGICRHLLTCALLCNVPRRYKLIAERPSRPQGEALDYMIMQALNPNAAAEGEDGKPGAGSFLDQLRRTMSSLQYFMKSLSN
jgi:hypothetical protein